MKRLLAYLFIVLGLGLTFSVNAKEKKKPIDIWNLDKAEPSQTQTKGRAEIFLLEFENLDKQFDKLNNGYEVFDYAKKLEDFNIEKCNLYLSKIEKQSSTVNKSLVLIKKLYLEGLREQINEDVLTRYLLKFNEYEDQFNKVKNNKFDCNNIKTAKAEPSQTQEGAGKFLKWRIIHKRLDQEGLFTTSESINADLEYVIKLAYDKCRIQKRGTAKCETYLIEKHTSRGIEKIFQSNNSKTQIAKAETSKTQKVASSTSSSKKFFDEVNVKPLRAIICGEVGWNWDGIDNMGKYVNLYIFKDNKKSCEAINQTEHLDYTDYLEIIKNPKLYAYKYGRLEKHIKNKICVNNKNLVNNLNRNCDPNNEKEVFIIRGSGKYIYLSKNKLTETQIAKAEPTVKPKKKVEVAKVEDSTQEEFEPKKTNQDNEAPVIEIAEAITVDSQAYTLKGKVKDKSRFQLTIDDRPIKVAKNGQFEFEGFAIDSKEQLKIVAIDRWKNKSEKVINVEVKIKQVADIRSYEKPNPSKIKVKKDNNKIGIIIGIEKYQNLNNIDAPYANRDAKAFKAYANIALGIPNNNLKVLIDEDATRGELLKSLKIWLPQITRGKEKDIYIFFAGHGLASDNGEDLHILPHNGDPILLEDTALSRVEMFDLINKVSPKSVTMFFDTCYSGQTRSEQMLVAGLRPVRIVANEQDTPNNFTIFTASNYDQTSGSINEAEHGIFSYYLMKGLEGKADENSDKKITNGELISYLKNNVTQEAFSQNRSQEPMLAGDPEKVLISYR